MLASQARISGSEPDIGQAPGDLATLQAFVNTLDIEQGTDALATPAGLRSWLREADLATDRGEQVGPDDLALAIDLREALRRVLRSHVTHKAARGPAGAGPAGAGPVATLTEVAAGLQAGLHAEPDGRVVVVPADSGTRAALTRLLLIAAEAGTAGTWPRLKVCGADDCQWAFYDRSPTRSGCWCSMQICGSRAKSRAYRNRTSRRPRSDT
jgi:predicted RNA-binding Zn ribbon-like protein